jgi:hypothetical protein
VLLILLACIGAYFLGIILFGIIVLSVLHVLGVR